MRNNEEDRLCVELFEWAWNFRPHTRRLIVHTPNGGSRNKIEAAKFKHMGVIAGYPDYKLHLPGGRVALIEVKTPTGKLSDKQKQIHELYASLGIPIHIVRTMSEWQALIDFYYPQTTKNNNHES